MACTVRVPLVCRSIAGGQRLARQCALQRIELRAQLRVHGGQAQGVGLGLGALHHYARGAHALACQIPQRHLRPLLAGKAAQRQPGFECCAGPVIGDAQGAQWAIGKSGTARVVEEARVRAGARMARVVRQGQPVTQVFDAQRLSLEVDGGGKVTAARCG